MFYLNVDDDFIIGPPLSPISDAVPGEALGYILDDQPPLALVEDQITFELSTFLPSVVWHYFFVIVVEVRFYTFCGMKGQKG